MTVVAVMVDPPRPGLALSELAGTSPLTDAEAAELYAAMLKDTFIAIEGSGGELLVNYRPDELLPDAHRTDTDPQAQLRALAADALEDVSDVRFEPQVGSNLSARAGNTITHLLREEGADSAAIMPGTAPLVTRATIDTAAASLRRASVVLGPSADGLVHYAGFTDPGIDFTDAIAGTVLSRLARRAADADLETAFIEYSPVVERGADLRTLLALLEAREIAGKSLPAFTTARIEEIGLAVEDSDESRIVRT